MRAPEREIPEHDLARTPQAAAGVRRRVRGTGTSPGLPQGYRVVTVSQGTGRKTREKKSRAKAVGQHRVIDGSWLGWGADREERSRQEWLLSWLWHGQMTTSDNLGEEKYGLNGDCCCGYDLRGQPSLGQTHKNPIFQHI